MLEIGNVGARPIAKYECGGVDVRDWLSSRRFCMVFLSAFIAV